MDAVGDSNGANFLAHLQAKGLLQVRMGRIGEILLWYHNSLSGGQLKSRES